MSERGFLLLEKGPLMAPEPVHQRGDADLFDANGLQRISQAVLAGRMPQDNYQARIAGLSDWRRRGTAHDLAPLARQLPLAASPQWRPLPRATLDAAFTLAPGGYRLSEADKGDPLQTGLGGFGTPAGTATSAGTSAGAATAGAAPAAGAPAPTKIKLKVKVGGGGGGTKRRRDGSEGPAG